MKDQAATEVQEAVTGWQPSDQLGTLTCGTFVRRWTEWVSPRLTQGSSPPCWNALIPFTNHRCALFFIYQTRYGKTGGNR